MIEGIPNTSHVRAVCEKAAEVGLLLSDVQPILGTASTAITFRKAAGYNLRVIFDKRGYIKQAGGCSPEPGHNSWGIAVDNTRGVKTTPKEALDILVNRTMDGYRDEVMYR